MFTGIWKWWRKKNGWHVCEEFTQWDEVRVTELAIAPWRSVDEAAKSMEELAAKGYYTHRYQERKCTMCGKIERAKI